MCMLGMHDSLWGGHSEETLYVFNLFLQVSLGHVRDNSHFQKISQTTAVLIFKWPHKRLTIGNTCFQNTVKVCQKPHWLKRESLRTSIKIASVLFIDTVLLLWAVDYSTTKHTSCELSLRTATSLGEQSASVHHVMFNLASCCSRQRNCRDHCSQR